MEAERYAFDGYARADAALEDARECRACEGDALECDCEHPYNVRALRALRLIPN